VAAVATILGLLLVVTVLANYLTTQLPTQMQLNDANRALAVENQVVRLATSLRAAAESGALGAVVSQPVSLGSAGAPPFAAPDGGSIGPGTLGSQLTESFTVTGGSTYAPPTVGPAGGTTKGDSCTTSSTSLTCSGSSKVVWNFTGSGPFTIGTSGGPYYVNTSASNTSITMTASSTSSFYLLVVGSNDTVSVTISGTGTNVHVLVLGSNDVVSFPASSWSSSTAAVEMVGNHDSVSAGGISATSSALQASFFGSNDSLSLGTISATSSRFTAYFTGFAPANPSGTCPDGNLAASTDSVSGPTAYSGSGTYNVTYNDTTTSSGSSSSPWTAKFATPSGFACPFFSTATIPQKNSGAGGASFVVDLRNSYEPQVVVAFDQGAVVYAQPAGTPFLLVGPQIGFVRGDLTLWVPEFLGGVGTLIGVGTAELSVRLVSLLNLSLPASGFALSGTTSVAVTTPFAYAWTTYFGQTSSFAKNVTCVPKASSACAGPFSLNGPLGTVYLNMTASALSIQVATYSISLG
jgi:hypothetical protein